MLTVEDHLQAAISSRVMSERIAARTHVKFDGIDFYLDDASATDFSLGSLGRKAAVESVRIMAPGPELADRLLKLAAGFGASPACGTGPRAQSSEYEDTQAFERVELVAAWERLSAWASAQAVRQAAALAKTPEMNPVWPESAGDVAEPNVSGEELAMRLACSRSAADGLVDLGTAFEGALAQTGAALAVGEIDLLKAKRIHRRLAGVADWLAVAVQGVVLRKAARRTATEISRDISRALLKLDPAGARDRARRAVCTRMVGAPRPQPDGMASIWMLLPAAHATQIDASLDAAARSLRAQGDSRSLDQLRADLLTTQMLERDPLDVFNDERARSGLAPVPPFDAAGSTTALTPVRAVRPSARTLTNVTVAYTTLLGLDDLPGELDGYGPISAEVARELAAKGTWRRILTDPVTGQVLDVGRTRYRPPASIVEHVRMRDRRCARPGCSAPAVSCDLDHTIEYHRSDGTTGTTNMGPLCRRDHRIKTDGGFILTQPDPGVFEWRTPCGYTYRVWPGESGRYELITAPSWRREGLEPRSAQAIADWTAWCAELVDQAVRGVPAPAPDPEPAPVREPVARVEADDPPPF